MGTRPQRTVQVLLVGDPMRPAIQSAIRDAAQAFHLHAELIWVKDASGILAAFREVPDYRPDLIVIYRPAAGHVPLALCPETLAALNVCRTAPAAHKAKVLMSYWSFPDSAVADEARIFDVELIEMTGSLTANVNAFKDIIGEIEGHRSSRAA